MRETFDDTVIVGHCCNPFRSVSKMKSYAVPMLRSCSTISYNPRVKTIQNLTLNARRFRSTGNQKKKKHGINLLVLKPIVRVFSVQGMKSAQRLTLQTDELPSCLVGLISKFVRHAPAQCRPRRRPWLRRADNGSEAPSKIHSVTHVGFVLFAIKIDTPHGISSACKR